MARNYRALLVPTAAIDAAGRAKPESVFSVTPMAGGSPVAVYGGAQGGSALGADQIKTDALGNISGLYVAEPGPYTLSFTGGGTVVTTAIVDPRDTASPGDVDAAVAGVIGGSGGAGSGVSLNPDGSIQDSVGLATAWSPPLTGDSVAPPFDSGAAGGSPAYPDVFTWADGWFTVHQDGLYLVQGFAQAGAYSHDTTKVPATWGWFAFGKTDNPYYLSGLFSTEDSRRLYEPGSSFSTALLPLPAGAKVALNLTARAGVDELTISYAELTITQTAVF